MNSKNIFIVGAMGSGKTSIGKLLAKKLNRRLIDTDHQIIKNHNKSITEIFDEFGEEYFRELETQELKKIVKIKNLIISTGGGIILREENIEIINNYGYVIFLDIDIKSQIKRLRNRHNRPLLDDHNLVNNLISLKKNRDPIYKNISDYIIDVSNIEKDLIIEKIQIAIK